MRVKTGTSRRQRHKQVLKRTKGMRMTKGRLYRVSKEADLHAGQYAFIGRKLRKRQFRRLWIQRINAGLSQKEDNPKYSVFIKLLKDHHVQIDRKILALLAATDIETFQSVVDKVKK
jgi:large subunit ribosomal protein L20